MSPTEGFEALLEEHLPALTRFVNFKINDRSDAEDIVQEACMKAFVGRDSLKDEGSFKPWLIAIARNLCTDYYRRRAKRDEISLELIPETTFTVGIHGRREDGLLQELPDGLTERDREILRMHYLSGTPVNRIAQALGIPEGTVKSRLFNARRRLKAAMGHKEKGETNMKDIKKMPEIMPEYRIEKTDEAPFEVKWEEMMGWFIVPRLGEKLSWAMYDFPERKRTELCEMEVVGRAEVHGIEGVEIRSMEYDPMECNSAGGQDAVERRFVAQLTDTHCRILAESHTEGGVKRYYTFLDGDAFLDSWGFGEDNCGNAVHIAPKGDIVREGDRVTTADKKFLLDVVGRYRVTLGGREYDTVCVMDCFTYMENEAVVSEQYLDREGRTVLWRRFNRDDWHFESYGKKWTEMLPENERITVNGETYVHWYDCITDRVI